MSFRVLFTSSRARTRLILNLLGAVFLVGGLSTASCIWCAQDRIDRQASAEQISEMGRIVIAEPLATEDSRRYARDVELYYGKSGLLLEKWTRDLEALSQGKPLAKTIAVVSVVVACGLFLLATAYRPERQE